MAYAASYELCRKAVDGIACVLLIKTSSEILTDNFVFKKDCKTVFLQSLKRLILNHHL
jgi:hypothetical protein